MNKQKTLGIIGGMGPLATAYLAQMLSLLPDVKTDQEHINLLIHEYPSTPDRTAYILGKSSESPLGEIIRVGRQLCDLGADLIAIPCVTSHYFFEEISKSLSAPVENMLDATKNELISLNVKKVGIMATSGTVKTGLFQNCFSQANIECVIPDDENQKAVMSLIYDDVKAGKPINRDNYKRVSGYLEALGAEKIILGCTELSAITVSPNRPDNTVCALESLAKSCLKRLGVKLR